MRLLLTTEKGAVDITQLVPKVTWSGSKGECSRALDFSLLYAYNDPDIPKVDCPLGANVQLAVGDAILFDGFVMTRTRNTDSSQIQVSCFDRGLYLKRNQKAYKFTGASPAQIVGQIANDFGVSVGYLPDTAGITITRNFLQPSVSLYDIIATAYTLAYQSTRIPYHVGFEGDKLCVREIIKNDKTLILQSESNLIAASMTDSIEKMVNTVAILDGSGNEIQVLRDEEAIALYGLFRSQVSRSNTDNKVEEARRMLEDNGVSQKITVDSLGNTANITGGTVVLRESYTGLYGLFYIESDSHEWKNGLYYNKLTLSFQAVMDEKEAGELPNATGVKTQDKDTSTSRKVVWKNKSNMGVGIE